MLSTAITCTILAFLAGISCSRVLQDKVSESVKDRNAAYPLVFIFVSVAVVTIVRYITKIFRIPVPYTLVALVFGFVTGIVVDQVELRKSFIQISKLAFLTVKKYYLPLIMFKTAFCIDVHAFLKSLTQIVIVAVPAAFLSACFCGLVMRVLIDVKWDFVDGLFMGILLSPIYPTETMRSRELHSNPHIKHIVTLLEGETILSATCMLYIYAMLTGFITGYVVYWYHFVMGLLRLIFLGLPTGYVCGLLGSTLMRLTYNQTITLVTLTVAMAFSSFYVGDRLFDSGILCTVCTGLLMSIERTTLPPQTAIRLNDVWFLLCIAANALVFLTTGALTPLIVKQQSVTSKDVLLVFVTYLLCNIGRFISYVIFFPILKRIGYGMTFRQLLFCVWIGVKNPLVLGLITHLIAIYKKGKASIFFLHIVSIYTLFLLINGTLLPLILKLLNLLELSKSRQVTMNNCMKYISQARDRTITILKMDKFLSDANWPLVVTSTILKHPYKKNVKKEYEIEEREEDAYLMGNRYAICPDCKKSLPTEPTTRELQDMTREAKMRVLKLKKICYSRLYENGMISNDGLRNLHQAIHTAMDSEEALIKLDGLSKLFNKEGFFYRFLKKCVVLLCEPTKEDTKPPRKHWRLVCYRIVKCRAFRILMYLALFFNISTVMYSYIASTAVHSIQFYFIIDANTILFLLFFTEFWLKIFAYSWIYIFEHGVKQYFRSTSNTLDFIVLIATFADLVLDIIVVINPAIAMRTESNYVLFVILAFRLMTVLRIFQFIHLCKGAYPRLLKSLDRKIDAHRAMAYELGKNYLTAEEEILENLNNIIDNEKIREVLREQFDKDRLFVTKMLGLAQKDRPKATIFVKTKLVMRTVLNSIQDDIHELKASGWVDNLEYAVLLDSLAQQRRYVKSIKFVQPSSPKMIFQEIAWMGNNEQIVNFLYEKVTIRKFDEGEIVCDEGQLTEGIYVLITGLLKVSYKPKPEFMEELRESGALPIADYISSTSYDETLSDYIVTGNCIGELSVLTKRPYNCVVIANSYAQVYVLRYEVLKEAMEMDSDPITGLEARMWKTVGVRIAIPLLRNAPAYRTFTTEQIKFTIEPSFMPDLTNYKVFVANEMMQDILLIEGRAIDFNTRTVYIGPCYIPRCVQRLILPKSSFFDKPTKIESRLLIIPAKGFNEYEIMIEEGRVCELVAKVSSQCLQHLAQQKLSRNWRPRQTESKTSRSKSRVEVVASVSSAKRSGHGYKV